MINLDAPKCFLGNAIVYGKSGDIQTVMVNLEFIKELLDNPNKENENYDWDDFK